MLKINLFPAIVLVGPPNCGKSAFAFLLTRVLRQRGIAHILLHTAPNSENDWFLKSDPDTVHTLRMSPKHPYSSHFIHQVIKIVESRMLPLLGDIGSWPQGGQPDILRACTHAVLLYRTVEERVHWQAILSKAQLLTIAELRSQLDGPDRLDQKTPVLLGQIGGLSREADLLESREVFYSVLDLVAGICRYDEDYLEREHTRRAPYPILNEHRLAQQMGVTKPGETFAWEPAHLEQIGAWIPAGEPRAVYGQGPVWLAATLATHLLPAPTAFFDRRLGWVDTTPPARRQKPKTHKIRVYQAPSPACWLEFYPSEEILAPYDLVLPELSWKGGLVLSGRLPRWAFASLACAGSSCQAWIGIDEPNRNRIVVVYSNDSSLKVGTTFPRPPAEMYATSLFYTDY